MNGWLAIFLFYLLPLIGYVLLFGLFPRKHLKVAAFVMAGICALISISGTLYLLFSSNQYSSGDQIVWTGVSNSKELQIGGNAEKSVVGWTSGTFSPSIKAIFDETNANNIKLSIGNGRGFVFNERGQNFLNGDALSVEKEVISNDKKYVISLKSYLYFWRYVEISGGDKAIVWFYLPKSNRTKIYSLGDLVEQSEIVGDAKSDFYQLRDWAADVRFLKSSRGEIRILEGEKNYTQTVELDPETKKAKLTIFWIGLRLQTELAIESNSIAVNFLPPWRWVSPIPPPDKDDKRILFFKSQPDIGEKVFEIPINGSSSPINAVNPVNKVENISRNIVKNDKGFTFAVLPKKPTDKKTTDTNLPENISSETKTPEKSPIDDATSTSKIQIETGDNIKAATVKNLFHLPIIVFLVVIALLCFLLGLFFCSGKIPEIPFWLIGGIAVVFWNILAFRLLLAFRYTFPAEKLDALSIEGVGFALLGLTIAPSLIFLAVRFRWDLFPNFESATEVRLRYNFLRIYLFILTVAFGIVYWLPDSLWQSLPDTMNYQIGWMTTGILVFLLLFSWRLGRYLYVDNIELWQEEEQCEFPLKLNSAYSAKDLNDIATRRRENSTLWFIFMFPLMGIEYYTDICRNWWLDIANWKIDLWAKRNILYVLFTIIGMGFVFVLLPFGIRKFAPFGDTIIHDLIIPFIFVWIPVCFWLSSAYLKADNGTVSFRKTLFFAFLLFAAPIAFIPMAIGDIGSLMAILAIYIPLSLLLLCSKIKPHGWATLGVLFLGLVLASVLYLSFIPLMSSYVGSTFNSLGLRTASTRLLLFKNDGIAKYIAFANTKQADRSGNFSYQNLRNGYQHLEEQRHLAHEGGWTGKGFVEAPARKSQIRQDTLQFDSVYSFFVSGDYGLLGGVCLLIIFAIPLGLICFVGREYFDIGFAFATLIAAAFLFEALFHAAMNVSAIPFTGRNLPLLAVVSDTDLFRWTGLFALIANAVLWRYRGEKAPSLDTLALFCPVPRANAIEVDYHKIDDLTDSDADLTESIIDDDSTEEEKTVVQPKASTPQNQNIFIKHLNKWRDIKRKEKLADKTIADYFRRILDNDKLKPSFWKFSTVFSVVIGGLLGLIIYSQYGIINDARLDNPFNWNELLEYVANQIDAGNIKVDKDKKIVVDEKIGSVENAFINEEIEHFNSLSKQERQDQKGEDKLIAKLVDVKNVAEYNQKLNEIRVESLNKKPTQQPSLFKLEISPKFADNPKNNQSEPEYDLKVNKEFNVVVSFKEPKGNADIPTVSLVNDEKPIVGAGWKTGRWVTTFNQNQTEHEISWLGYFASAVEKQWLKLKPEDKAQYSKLTLDKGLHLKANSFVREKGFELHEKLIQKAQNAEEKLPPRIALSVLQIPNGEVLALGGYPKAFIGNNWRDQTAGNRTEVSPSINWLESKEVPRALRVRYEGERNFELYQMGSSTKPLIAAAALRVHPSMKFAIKETSNIEDSIFGIKLGKEWTTSSTNGWYGLKDFLKTSHNGYQVRLGFLGLAERNNGDVVVGENSASEKESLDGGKTILKKYPMFPSDEKNGIKFSAKNPNEMANLHLQPFANNLRDMFGIKTGNDKLKNFRHSFWTGNWADNLNDENKPSELSGIFSLISPQTVNFQLNSITDPRGEFVSLLLGGYTNRWSNTDFAGAFGTCLTGKQIVHHITQIKPNTAQNFQEFSDVSEQLKSGLFAVANEKGGTAYNDLQKAGVLDFAKKTGAKIYAKTGTLANKKDEDNWTRLVLAIVKEENNKIIKGIVFSIVIERDVEKKKVLWIGEYIMQNQDVISKILSN